MSDEGKNERAAELDRAIKKADEEKKMRADADADKAAGEKLDKLLTGIGGITTSMDALCKRVDALEKGAKPDAKDAAAEQPAQIDDDDEFDNLSEAERENYLREERESAMRAGTPGTPDATAADARKRFDAMRAAEDANARRRRMDARKADAQARADSVASGHGLRAPPPMNGETVKNYRVRLLRDFQQHSKTYHDVDLAAIADPKLLRIAETQIFADSIAVAKNPQANAGARLRMVHSALPSGHQETKFYGHPSAWMSRFAGSKRMLTGTIAVPRSVE